MLLGLFPVIASIMSRNPGGQKGNSVSDSGVGEQAGQQDTGDQSGQQASGEKQTSPTALVSPLQDAQFYALDPNDPESRVTGVQLREAVNRARQFDGLQSSHHRLQNQYEQAQQEIEKLRNAVSEYQTASAVQRRLSEIGFDDALNQGSSYNQAAGNQMQSGVTQQPPGQGTQDGSMDDWGYEADTGEGFDMQYDEYGRPIIGQAGQSRNPAQQGQHRQAGANNPGAPISAETLARNLLPVFEKLIDSKLTPALQRFEQQSQQRIQQLERGMQDKEEIASAHAVNRNMRKSELVKLGLDDEQVTNILDYHDMSRTYERSAEELISEAQKQTDPQQRAALLNQAKEQMKHSTEFHAKAARAEAEAIANHEKLAKRQQFEANIETNPFAAVGVEEPEVDYNLKDPKEIQNQNQDAVNRAIQMAEGIARMESTL